MAAAGQTAQTAAAADLAGSAASAGGLLQAPATCRSWPSSWWHGASQWAAGEAPAGSREAGDNGLEPNGYGFPGSLQSHIGNKPLYVLFVLVLCCFVAGGDRPRLTRALLLLTALGVIPGCQGIQHGIERCDAGRRTPTFQPRRDEFRNKDSRVRQRGQHRTHLPVPHRELGEEAYLESHQRQLGSGLTWQLWGHLQVSLGSSWCHVGDRPTLGSLWDDLRATSGSPKGTWGVTFKILSGLV